MGTVAFPRLHHQPCVRWEGVDDEVRVCEGVREAYITIAFPRWKSFSSSAVCTCMKREKVNSIPAGWTVLLERRTKVICTCVGVPGFEGV